MVSEMEYAGYLFVYFTGEGTENGEQIYFALSKGNDPLNWIELNGGKPVLTSRLGEKGVRDPYIIRSPHEKKFYLVATDLKIYGNGNWGRSVTEGSRSIIIWESTNLVNWSEQRMVELASPDAGCTWAPEVYFDNESEEFIVFWASMLQNMDGTDRYHRMMYVTTKDFISFSKPQVFIDEGFSVIDTTIIEHQEQIFRFSKGEQIIQESGRSFFDPQFKMINEKVELDFMSRGEGPIIFKSNIEEKWYLFIDEYGLRGYLPLETTDLTSGVWTMPEKFSLPTNPRHGSVIPVTLSEYKELLQTFVK
ncbi:glycoside hydrolase family 43 protein [Metabacillus halosaccharovorans]|uniref:glycoside hydrolase family 43 protein n=1 Tax=Metabacillus halosaccharovorans TaxID=930124 RepID=UPI00203E26EC|nr:glycoside hydrolase family 43 protein [Metabacillus halosaccharovorans]MCM3443662.1 glycoside hydrolase family 43 protein [Metabacillus halosaccharovorans]